LATLCDADSTDGKTQSKACGTPNYVAPEVLSSQQYDGRKADVWSLGVILFVLLAGFLPFEESTKSALFRKICTADFQYPAWFGSDVKELLNLILVVDPSKRISLEQFKNHPWVMDGMLTNNFSQESEDKSFSTDSITTEVQNEDLKQHLTETISSMM
jgi:serine/threonine protein kinase